MVHATQEEEEEEVGCNSRGSGQVAIGVVSMTVCICANIVNCVTKAPCGLGSIVE